MSEITENRPGEAEMNTQNCPLILGTAGHIDHGKTSLIRALTGAETDRLPEEKKRGITIELGFANLRLPPFNFGIVDVPGHQKFVRTMLSGATGIDVALVVVAADDSINQQTREHFEILQFLEVPTIVIAITKVDRVEDSWCDLVEDEIRDWVSASRYADCVIVRTSAISGVGLTELKDAIVEAGNLAYLERSSWQTFPFRMPIDRVFTREGYGTVVTGSITHGEIHIGDSVQVVPGGEQLFRVRQIQSHDQSLDTAVRGQRAALNLVGADVELLDKGNLLVRPESMPTSFCLTVRLTISQQRQGIKNHQVVRLHVGTSDVLGQIRFIEPATTKATTGGDLPIFAQVILKSPIAVNWRQRIVIRRVSPVETIGVAEVISLQLPKQSRWSKNELAMLKKLSSDKACERVESAVYFCLDGQVNIEEIASDYFLKQETVEECLAELKLQPIEDGNQRLLYHPLRLDYFSEIVERGLNRMHDAHPKRWLLEWDRVYGLFSFLPSAVLRYIFKSLNDKKRIRQSPRGVGLADRGPELTKNQQKRYEWILEQFLAAGLSPPSISQCSELADKNKQDVPELIKLAVDAGELADINSEIILSQSVMLEAWTLLQEHFKTTVSGLTVAQIRDVLGVSRKMTIPLCEYWDRLGWMRREGDLRFLTKNDQGSDDHRSH